MLNFRALKCFLKQSKLLCVLYDQSLSLLRSIKNILRSIKNIVRSIKNIVRSIKNKLNAGSTFSKTFPHIASLLAEEKLEDVIRYFEKKPMLKIYSCIRFLAEIYQFARKLENHTNINNNKKRSTILIHFCCWGAQYTDKTINYMLPSLLAEKNLPLLAKNHRVVLLIHCDELTKKRLTDNVIWADLTQHADIKIHTFPPKLILLYSTCVKKYTNNWHVFPTIRYLLLGVCQTHAFKTALQSRTYLSILMPDVVVSESFMSDLLTKLANKKIVFTTTYRTNFSKAKSSLNTYLKDNSSTTSLTITAKELTYLQNKHIHSNEYKRIVSTTTENFTPMARLLFRHKNGFVVRGLHQHPVYIDCTNIPRHIGLDYLPIDNTALNNLINQDLPLQDQAWVCQDASYAAIMELSDENPETNPIINAKTLKYTELVTQVRDLITHQKDLYFTPLNQFLVSHRHQFILDNFKHEDEECIDDIKFFNDVFASSD